MNNLDHISESLKKQIFELKYLNFLMRIRGKKNSDPDKQPGSTTLDLRIENN